MQIHLFIYNLIVSLYQFALLCLSPFHAKAKLLFNGRQQTHTLLETLSNQYHQCIYFHVSSLGEFEQARPIIEQLKTKYPDTKIVLSFFSPSGYEIRKNYSLADLILYLPQDNKSNAVKLWETLKPSQIIWVKYEFWYHMLHEAHIRKIPMMLICGNFRKDHIFFKWHGILFRRMLQFFNPLFVQNESSQSLLKEIHISADICPDTRFDRVFQIAQTLPDLPFIPSFIDNKKCLVFGSTWPADEEIIVQLLDDWKDYKIIIAPHQIDQKHLDATKEKFKQRCILYSQREQYAKEQVLIIDNIGMLATLYRYASIAYIGGAFGVSVHNILEAAVYGIPLVCGPHFTKSAEAIALKEKETLFIVHNVLDLKSIIKHLMENKDQYNSICEINRKYVVEHLGGTEKIMNYLER